MYKTLLCLTAFFLLGMSPSFANVASVPLNITVEGKLILTNSENDISGGSSSLNIPINSNQTKAIRVRSNINNWKLTAQRTLTSNLENAKNVNIKFETRSGSTANPNAARLSDKFNSLATLKDIHENLPVVILKGESKTSLLRDSKNLNNWFELSMNYGYENMDQRDKLDTVVSFSLVSP